MKEIGDRIDITITNKTDEEQKCVLFGDDIPFNSSLFG